MSKIIISILLCKMEADLFDDRDWLIDNDFYSPLLAQQHIHPTEVVNGIRHVDDVLIFSRMLCLGCLESFLTRMYKEPLEFSVEGRPPTAEFLDLQISAADNRLRYLLRQKNAKWTAGEDAFVTKTALPVVLGKPVITRRRVAAFLSVKLHRIHQLHPEGDDHRLVALTEVMSEVHMLGYSLPFIHRALGNIRNARILDLAAYGQECYDRLDHPRGD